MSGYIEIGASTNGGGGAGIIAAFNSLTTLLSTAGSTAGERRALCAGSLVVGVWRWSTVIGTGTWVPDGGLNFAYGADALWGAGVDGFPSTNTAAGSIAYTWAPTGLQVSGTGSTDQDSWWEFPLFSQAVTWDQVRGVDLIADIVVTGAVEVWTGPYVGEMRDNGATVRNNVLSRYRANNQLLGVVYQGVNNTAASNDQALDYAVRTQYLQSAVTNNGVVTTAGVGTAAVAPSTLTLAATDVQANHQAGDTFQRFGLGHAEAVAGAGAWTVTLRSLTVHIVE